jgi:hypothetical protein
MLLVTLAIDALWGVSHVSYLIRRLLLATHDIFIRIKLRIKLRIMLDSFDISPAPLEPTQP